MAMHAVARGEGPETIRSRVIPPVALAGARRPVAEASRAGHPAATVRSSVGLVALQRGAGNRATTAIVRGDVLDTSPRRDPDRGSHVVSVARQEQDAGSADRAAEEEAATDDRSTACTKVTSRADYLAVDGTSRDDFGLTVLDASRVRMVWSITPVGRGSRVRVALDTPPVLPTIPSVATGAGRFPGSQGPTTRIVPVVDRGPCAGRRAEQIPLTWSVTRDGADKIREAEEEHCADYRYAFDQSLAIFAHAVQRAARRTWPSERRLKRALRRYAGGADPDDWEHLWATMVRRTRRRDRRGHHTPRIGSRDTWVPTSGTNCRVVVRVRASALPEVGNHSSVDIMG